MDAPLLLSEPGKPGHPKKLRNAHSQPLAQWGPISRRKRPWTHRHRWLGRHSVWRWEPEQEGNAGEHSGAPALKARLRTMTGYSRYNWKASLKQNWAGTTYKTTSQGFKVYAMRVIPRPRANKNNRGGGYGARSGSFSQKVKPLPVMGKMRP